MPAQKPYLIGMTGNIACGKSTVLAELARRGAAVIDADRVTHDLQQPGQPVYTQIVAAGPFYKAEEYHQDYYKKNEARYKFYRWNCGRDQRLEQLWGKKES